jgi:hypothetical protein
MDLTAFLQDKKTPLLRPRLTHVIGQFTAAQAGSGILTGPHEARIYDDVMAPGVVDNFKDGCPDVLIPPGALYLAGEFPLKILPYRTNLHLNGVRHAHLLLPALLSALKAGKNVGISSVAEANSEAELLVEGEKDKLRSLIGRLDIECAIVEGLRHLSIQYQDLPA